MVAVVLAALTTGVAFAHTLELPQKLDYDAATWTQLQHSLYRYFAVVGGPLEVATIIAAVVFAVRARGLRGGRLAAVGAACFVLALGWWFAVVKTSNAEVGRWAVDAVPSDWRRWRAQWERGHAGHFVVTFAGVPGAAGRHRACRRPGSPACPWSLLAHRRQPCPMARTWKALPGRATRAADEGPPGRCRLGG